MQEVKQLRVSDSRRVAVYLSEGGRRLELEEFVAGAESRWIRLNLHGKEIPWLLDTLLESVSGEPECVKLAKRIARSALGKAHELTQLDGEHVHP